MVCSTFSKLYMFAPSSCSLPTYLTSCGVCAEFMPYHVLSIRSCGCRWIGDAGLVEKFEHHFVASNYYQDIFDFGS